MIRAFFIPLISFFCSLQLLFGSTAFGSIQKIEKPRESSFVVIGNVYRTIFCKGYSETRKLIDEIKKCRPQAIILNGNSILGTHEEEVEKYDKLYDQYVITTGKQHFADESAVENSLEKQWGYVHSVFKKINVPVWITPGKYDLISADQAHQAVIEKMFQKKAGKSYFEKRLDGYRLIFLDTNNKKEEVGAPVIDEEQLNWLDSVFKASLPGEKFLVFLHAPLWYAGYRGMPDKKLRSPLNWMEEIHPIIKGKTEYVFAGDYGTDKQYLFYEYRDGVYYYVNGSSMRGISFLNIVIKENQVDVYPHFIKTQEPPVKKAPLICDADRSYEEFRKI